MYQLTRDAYDAVSFIAEHYLSWARQMAASLEGSGFGAERDAERIVEAEELFAYVNEELPCSAYMVKPERCRSLANIIVFFVAELKRRRGEMNARTAADAARVEAPLSALAATLELHYSNASGPY